MKKADKHISVPQELVKRIEKLCRAEHKKFSIKVCELTEKALDQEEHSNDIEKVYAKIDSLNQKVYILLELVKQIYSDMDFNNLSDPGKSFALNEFLKRIKGDKLDD